MDALSQVLTSGDVNCDALRQMFVEKQQVVEGLRARVQELGQTRLMALLQDMAALQVTRVLHGDYDLKIARQDYFTSKQDEVSCRSHFTERMDTLISGHPCLIRTPLLNQDTLSCPDAVGNFTPEIRTPL